MISVWPKFDAGSANYDQLNAANCFYKDSRDGSTYGNYYDAYSANCRSIYWSQIQKELFDNYGWDAFWLDASEWEAPAGARAYVTTAAGPGVNYYNAYPLEHTKAVYEGQVADTANTKRVFTLTRSAYAGQQRYAAASWSGDTSASFTEMANQLTGGLNFSISGIPYWSEDIGGYTQPAGGWSTTANNELFTRWFEKGVFDPIFRIHGQYPRELYGAQWNAQTKAALLASDQLRYRLMPYIYSLAGAVTQSNYTMMRPLVMDFQSDPKVYSIKDEYMFGPSILVAPVTAAGVTSRSVYLPSGLWYDFWTGQQVTGGQTITAAAPYDHIPLYVKAGSIIPMGAANSQYASQAATPTEIRVYPGADGKATFYADSGDTNAYTTGAFQNIPLTYSNSSNALTMGTSTGSYAGMPTTRNLRVVFVNSTSGTGIGETTSAPTSTYQGQPLTVTSTTSTPTPTPTPTTTTTPPTASGVISLRAHANNQYVTADNAGASALIANRTAIGGWETFDLINNSDGTISLRSHANNMYVTAENAGASPLIANRTAIGGWEEFTLVNNADGSISLQSHANNLYVTAENAGASALIANRTAIGGWEEFDRIND
jgi:alpha-D-xyloside xylohydrolase